ncbi:LuxR C-terminal-related transcriptional regulator [Zhaonella formicivorans]|uniref:LuxR C-terminal-related transcriptional regulator n=1 Tax=Zhaonella formicivorans TaxID=2528593 RepID=UPI0010D17EDD|nr:LuxR C-terminal-related transcriptional regulator [Zhaonella formicivorans]
MWEDGAQMLQAVLDSVDAAILMVDSRLQVVLCNSRFGDFFGLDPSALIGQDKRTAITRDIKWRVQNPEEFEKRLFWLYENPEVTAHDEVEVSIPRRRILQRFSGPVFNKKQQLLGRVEVYTDITQAKSVQEEMEFKNAQLFLLNVAATAVNESLETDNLCKLFLQRVKQATGAQAGILYIKDGKQLKLAAATGTLLNLQKLPKWLPDLPDSRPFYGPEKQGTVPQSLACALQGIFFVGFPALYHQEAWGLCILTWDKMLPKLWLNEALFVNMGIQLGMGIHNAQLLQRARLNALQAGEQISTVDFTLSPREKQVLAGLAAGMSNKEIALNLQISAYTVKNHVRNILEKLNVRSRGQAAAEALRRGFAGTLIPAEEETEE